MASTSAGLPAKPPRSRPPELEDALNRFVFHPLSLRLALLLRPTGISPNAVSVAGMLLVWGSAATYVGLAWPESVAIGLTLQLLWHVVDGADGDLARLTGRSSPTGELVDGVCDYAGYAAIYLAFAGFLQAQIGGWAWAVAIAAAASHILQTNHAETQRRYYLWWVYGVPWLKNARAEGDEVFDRRNPFTRLFSGFARLYLRLTSRMSPFATVIDQEVEKARGRPERLAQISRVVRGESPRLLVLQKLLGANLRTLIVGASMALGTPLYFFLAEIVLYNLLLVWSVGEHDAAGRRMVETLG